MANPGRYQLTHHTYPILRTDFWKEDYRNEPADVWWLSGPGLSRPATDVEVDLWRQAVRKCLEIVKPFDGHGTLGEMIQKEFGL